MTIKLIIVDDHTMVRQGISKVLTGDNELELVAEAEDAETAISLVRDQAPDIVLMDIYMPGMDGLAATRVIVQDFPDSRVIFLTASSDEDDILEAARAGARGYALKSTSATNLIRQIKHVAGGGVAFSAEMTSKLVAGLASNKPSPAFRMETSPLTQREKEVLHLISQGQTNKSIAGSLVVSENTIRAHVRSLMQKLNMDNRTQLAIYGLREGFGDDQRQLNPAAATSPEMRNGAEKLAS